MRILFLMTQSLDSPGGVGRFMPVAKCLVRRGHGVVILALHHDFRNLRQRQFVLEGVQVKYVGQMHVRKVGDDKLYYRPAKMLWIATIATLKLALAALAVPADIVQVCKTQPMNGLAAWIVHRLRGTPVCLDSDDYEAAHNRFSARWQQHIVARFEDWMPSFACGIAANTTFIAERFRGLGYPSERILLIANGVDGERFAILETQNVHQQLDSLRQSIGITPTDRVIEYVGSISSVSHALENLLEAFADVLHIEPNALLLVVGGGEDLKRVKKQAYALGIVDRVRFTGRVPSRMIPFYYRLAEVSVDSVYDTLAGRSSLALKLVESIVAGVPCVTTDVGDRQAIAGEAGIAVPPDDPQSLAAAIVSILLDSKRAARMRAAARRMRSDLLWENKVRLFETMYLRCLRGNGDYEETPQHTVSDS